MVVVVKRVGEWKWLSGYGNRVRGATVVEVWKSWAWCYGCRGVEAELIRPKSGTVDVRDPIPYILLQESKILA